LGDINDNELPDLDIQKARAPPRGIKNVELGHSTAKKNTGKHVR